MLAGASILTGCAGDEPSGGGPGDETATAARPDRLRDVRTPAAVCGVLPPARLRAALLDPHLLPSLERSGLKLMLEPGRERVFERTEPACVYAVRNRGEGFRFLTIVVARGADQPALRERLRRGGTARLVEVDVAGRTSTYDVGHTGRPMPAQLAVPAGDATLIVRPGITLGLDRTRDKFSPDRRRDGAVNIARAVLGEPFVDTSDP